MSRVTAQSDRYNNRIAVVNLPRYQAQFTLYVEASSGGSWCVDVMCVHHHTTPEAALECARDITAYAERREALPAYAREVCPGALASALRDSVVSS